MYKLHNHSSDIIYPCTNELISYYESAPQENSSETVIHQILIMSENCSTEITRNCGLKTFSIAVTIGNMSAKKANAAFGFGK